MPLISVIVPVYNVEDYICRCVDSILAQTFTDFELILVDDGSPDNCPLLCDEYAKKDLRIHVIHQENGGLSSARNAGIDWAFANSDSKWLSFVDSDDWIHPEMLQRLYTAVTELNLPLCISEFQTVSEETVMESDIPDARKWNTEAYYSHDRIASVVAWGKLYKKECFEDIRYPVGKIHEDEYVTYRILFAYSEIAVIDAPLYKYFQNPNGIMRSAWTPKRLDVLGAFAEQVLFFKMHGFEQAHREMTRIYAYVIVNGIENLKKNQPEKYSQSIRELQEELRNVISDGKKIKVIDIAYDYKLYATAYPRLKYFWKLMSKTKYLPQRFLRRLLGDALVDKMKSGLNITK